jgi:hypothetical protein
MRCRGAKRAHTVDSEQRIERTDVTTWPASIDCGRVSLAGYQMLSVTLAAVLTM